MKRSRISKLGHFLGIANMILGVSYNIFCYLNNRWYELDPILIGIILILVSDFSITPLKDEEIISNKNVTSLQTIVMEIEN